MNVVRIIQLREDGDAWVESSTGVLDADAVGQRTGSLVDRTLGVGLHLSATFVEIPANSLARARPELPESNGVRIELDRLNYEVHSCTTMLRTIAR